MKVYVVLNGHGDGHCIDHWTFGGVYGTREQAEAHEWGPRDILEREIVVHASEGTDS